MMALEVVKIGLMIVFALLAIALVVTKIMTHIND